MVSKRPSETDDAALTQARPGSDVAPVLVAVHSAALQFRLQKVPCVANAVRVRLVVVLQRGSRSVRFHSFKKQCSTNVVHLRERAIFFALNEHPNS